MTSGSPLAEFVSQRFNELWVKGKPLEELMRLAVTLVDTSSVERHFQVDYLDLNGRLDVVDQQIIAQLARRHVSIFAYCRHDRTVACELTIIDETEPDLPPSLPDHFQEKYGRAPKVFVCLRPVNGADPDESPDLPGDGARRRFPVLVPGVVSGVVPGAGAWCDRTQPIACE